MFDKPLIHALGAALATCALSLGPTPVSATAITFEADALGIVPNGFQSAESDLVRFSASAREVVSPGTLIVVAEVGSNEFKGTRGLAVFGSGNTELIMDFAAPVRSLSLFFGNDDFYSTVNGDRAVLTVFDGDLEIGQTSVVLNRNDFMDQRIAFSGQTFDRASFRYTAEHYLAETVDDISFVRVPEPGALPLLAIGAIGAIGIAIRPRRPLRRRWTIGNARRRIGIWQQGHWGAEMHGPYASSTRGKTLSSRGSDTP